MSYGTVQAEKMTTESGYSLGAGNASTFKNRFINGDMQIAQRGTGPVNNSVGGLGYDTIDRWGYWAGNTNQFSIQQSSVAPAGFTTSALITSLGALAQTSTTYATFSQRIEGFNIADLGWGTANAKPVTISFWIRSSLTGTFSAYVFNSGYSYCYPFTFNIPSANTWVQITQTVVGPTSGTWLTNNGIGLEFGITLLNGTSYQNTNATWVAASYVTGVAGSVNLLSTNGANMYVTGVQLEVGTVATSFDFVSYGTELALCQRYYERYSGQFTRVAISYGNNSGRVSGNITWKATKRTSPTLEISATNAFRVNDAAANRTSTNLQINPNGDLTQIASLITDVASGITTGAIYDVDIGVSNGWFAANSEL